MKKVLLCFLAALVTFVANADTLKVVPNDRITKEIAIDLAKYPFLTSNSYSWKHNGYDLGDTVKTVGTKTFVDVETAVKGVNDGFYYYEFTVNNVPVRDTVLYVHIYNNERSVSVAFSQQLNHCSITICVMQAVFTKLL